MKINLGDTLQLEALPPLTGRTAFVNIHDIMGGWGFMIFAPNKLIYVVKEIENSRCHFIIVPGDNNPGWIEEWMEDNREYFELVGPLKEIIDATAVQWNSGDNRADSGNS